MRTRPKKYGARYDGERLFHDVDEKGGNVYLVTDVDPIIEELGTLKASIANRDPALALAVSTAAVAYRSKVQIADLKTERDALRAELADDKYGHKMHVGTLNDVISVQRDEIAALKASIVECEACGFRYGSELVLSGGEHICPVCEEAKLRAEVEELRATALELVGKYHREAEKAIYEYPQEISEAHTQSVLDAECEAYRVWINRASVLKENKQ